MELRTDSCPNVKYVEVDFDEVEVGVTNIKSIKILNQCNVKQWYVVQRDPTSNPLDCVFHIVEYNWSLEPCESYVCDLSFRPILPNRRYTDYFSITDSHECRYEIVVRGTAVGPNVTISPSRLVLVCGDDGCPARRSFRLANLSGQPGRFAFDLDAAQSPFKLSETNGVLEPSASRRFEVEFQPGGPGIHRRQLACLVLNQGPLVIELYGICGLDANQLQAVRAKIDACEESDPKEAFPRYMSDVATALRGGPPAVSLSDCYVDFGQAEVGPENFGKRPAQTTSLTNHINSGLFIVWDEDVSKVFSVQPREARMRGWQSVVFELRFDPCDERAFYARELLARVFPLPCCPALFDSPDELLCSAIPEILSVRLAGHTYGQNANNWMPQYEIPETVTMPACAPGSAAYTTFAIRNYGRHPLAFSFVPPVVCRYSLKPMQGLITPEQEQQVVAVQLFAEARGEHAYVERWACRLNGSPENEACLDLQGYAERPGLNFGRDNRVTCGPVLPGCQACCRIPARNPTRHRLSYEFATDDFPEELCVRESRGVVHPNDTVWLDWTFTPDHAKTYHFGLTCHLTTEAHGKTCDVKVEFFGAGIDGSLMAVPEELDFGTREYGESSELEFKIFNFSPVEIHYLLARRTASSLETTSFQDSDAELSPARGTISPGKSERIRVIVTPSRPGRHEMVVEYLARPCASADLPIPLAPAKSLCRLAYTCYLSALQIKDLSYQVESNKNVSKISLWKSLNIDELNLALKDLSPYEGTSIEMTIPFDTLNDNEKFVIKLLLVNANPIKASCSFQKKKTCLCNDETAKKKPSTKRNSSYKCASCVLDRSCAIHPENIKLSPRETCVLAIEMSGSPLLSSGIFWDMDIGQRRCISLNIKFESSIISSGCTLKFKNVFVGQCVTAHYQAAWLYNNSENENTYVVDVKNLVKFNKKNCGIIFTCSSPEGVVNARDRKAVLFGFCPNRIGRFQVTVLVKMNDEESVLTIEAESTCSPSAIVASREVVPLSNTFLPPDIVVYFNNDCIIVPPLPTHGKETRILMVHNHHPLDVLQYQWENYEIPGVIKIKVEPSNGLIQPQSLLTFLVEVLTGMRACSLDINVFCNFTDVSERRLGEKKKAQQKNALRQLEDEFIITEKGTFYPKAPVFEEIKKPSTFCKTLTLKIDVYNQRDADEKVDLKQQLKSVPTMEILPEMTPCPDTFPPDCVNMFSQVIECVIWDIVSSNSFVQTFKNDLTRAHNLKYSQLPVNIAERKRQNERISRTAPKQYIEDILHTMINMIIHEEFNLNTDHFSHPVDVRQISYQKVYSGACGR